ncbi:MAG: class I SAM-dependent methyltransferase [Alphaproteobacteria bacterium]|nr:class I SAM-dependent methyltransferase [Alphaproteobacteria bacterium]
MSSVSQVATAGTTISVTYRNCPLCGRDNRDQPPSPYSLAPWTIRSCRDCGFTYIDTAPKYEHLAVDLDWNARFHVETERKAELRKVSYKFSRLTRMRMHLFGKRKVGSYVRAKFNQGRILDLGCGSGETILDLLDSFTPYGVEISTSLAIKADQLFRQHGGHTENAPSIEGLRRFEENFFEAVAMRSYLEHEENPLGVMKEVFRVLKPGGIAVVKVPNFGSLNRRVMGKKWCGFRYPDHLNYYTRSSLRQLAQKAGLDIRFDFLGSLPTSDNMWAILTKPA